MGTRTALLEQLRGCPKWLATLPADRFDMAMRARGISAPAAEARVALANLKREETAVKKSDVKVGEAYMLKVGKNTVRVTAKEISATGTITVVTKAGKRLAVSDAGRLTVQTTVDQIAPGAPRNASTSKGAKAARGRNVAQKGAPQPARRSLGEGGAKEKRVGLVDAAILVLDEAGNKPMNVKEIVETVLAKGIWKSNGRTPSATLYSCILREIQKKGSESRFKKVDRGLFALVG